MSNPIAIVATACEFPGARNPDELWQLAVHGRRCFRRIPPQRLPLADYAIDAGESDSIYPVEAGLIEGYRFDRRRFKVPKTAYAVTDLAHWLALDLADRALATLPAQWLQSQALRDRTVVIAANTLTGEFSRANVLRYRWPFVARQLRSAASGRMPAADVDALVDAFEHDFKAAFAEPDADSLAGGLSNTIAGRIANHFGLRGGAYTADGACASSLVAVVSACDRLVSGDVDCVLVTAVDLSIDPFELVGFARNDAMAKEDMRVFDQRAQGFWPGEGGACIVLTRPEIAQQWHWPVCGQVLGVGMSTDGQGGLTRPTQEGQLLAQRRAWHHAGIAPARAAYFEAHGTGTPTGDPVELQALAQLVGDRSACRGRGAVPVGSIKANIGHTKAAAGLAGLLKALAVVQRGVVPPTSGCTEPHAVLSEPLVRGAVRVARKAEAAAGRGPLLAGVNAFGFGGVNCHVVLQGPAGQRARVSPSDLPRYVETRLPGELVLLAAPSRDALAHQAEQIALRARWLARGELVDLAAAQPASGIEAGAWRACVVAETPQQLQCRCERLALSLRDEASPSRCLASEASWSAPAQQPPAIGFLFPGQGLAVTPLAADWARRFTEVHWPSPASGQAILSGRTADVQPHLAALAVAGVQMLSAFGLKPNVVLGHSFGELSALHAAGVFDAQVFMRLARARGCAMQAYSVDAAMLALHCDRASAQALAHQCELDLACHNTPERHVLAGAVDAIELAQRSCAKRGIECDRLPTQRAFHSHLMRDAQSRFAETLDGIALARPCTAVASTVTGALLGDESIAELLVRQFVEPVRFDAAVIATGPLDLLLEVGQASQLGQLVQELGGPDCLALGLAGPTLAPLLAALGSAWVAGARLDTAPLYAGRLVRPFDLAVAPSLFENPCGNDGGQVAPASVRKPVARVVAPAHAQATVEGQSAFDVLQAVICDLTELAREDVAPGARLLADLHLNSIRARQAVASAARRLGITSLPFNPAELAQASLADIAGQLEHLRVSPMDAPKPAAGRVPGIAAWVRAFDHVWREPAVEPRLRPEPTLRMELDDALAPLDAHQRALVAPSLVEDAEAPIVLVVPALADAPVFERLLQRVHDLIAEPGRPGMLVLQGAQLANAFLQSVVLEHPQLRLCAVQCDPSQPEHLAQAWSLYGQRARGYGEMRLTGTRILQRTVAALSMVADPGAWIPGARDLIMISGGARGIGAATAQWMGRRYRCRLCLLGRSPPDDDTVAATMAALRADGTQAQYLQVDLCDSVATAVAVQQVQQQLGPIRALVHAAGVNQPVTVRALDAEELHATWAAKVLSLDNLLAALAPGPLRLVVGYGSVIGAFGLAGAAHYALANEWMGERLARLASEMTDTRVLPVCWSAWRETGMAHRLPHVLEQLEQADVEPLATAQALEQLGQLIASHPAGRAVLVTGRYGRLPDAVQEVRALQRYRFLEWPRVWYPGVELVADSRVSPGSDPYLLDHAVSGVPVLPLVVAIEAMVSAAQCLCPEKRGPALCDLRIGDAVAWVDTAAVDLRVQALVEPDGSVRVALRCSTTDFAHDHFSAHLRWEQALCERSTLPLPPPVPGSQAAASQLLYAGVAFHGPAFRRIGQFQRVDTLGCVATLPAAAGPRWYGRWLPDRLSMPHPALRDAVLHALQACIPQHMVLPVAVARIVPGLLAPATNYVMHGWQVDSDAEGMSFDIDVRTDSGQLVEQWSGVRLVRVASAVQPTQAGLALPLSLLEAYVGRLTLDRLHVSGCRVGVVAGGRGSDAAQAAARRALGPHARLTHLADGAPVVAGHRVSITHADDYSLCVAHPEQSVACDVATPAQLGDPDWSTMLGRQRSAFAQGLCRRDVLAPGHAELMVWSVSECLSKLGRADWPFRLESVAKTAVERTGPVIELQSEGLRVVVGLVLLGLDQDVTAVAVAHLLAPHKAAPSSADDSAAAALSDMRRPVGAHA